MLVRVRGCFGECFVGGGLFGCVGVGCVVVFVEVIGVGV